MVILQALNGSAALTALLLAAIVAEQNTVRRNIEEARSALAEVVDQLAPGESAHLWPHGGRRPDGWAVSFGSCGCLLSGWSPVL